MLQPPPARSNGQTTESEMARRLRETEWSATPLGPIEQWPTSLRVAVGICFHSRFPMFVWWGPSRVNIYNDAYAPMLGRRHPHAFGRPAQEAWKDIWDTVGPQADAVMERGEATWNERVLLVMERNGFREDTWFTWSYSPIPDDQGGIGGVFCACTEDTEHVLAERERDRLAEQRQLALDSAEMGWWHIDPATGRVNWDRRFREIFGVATDEHDVDQVIGERLHPDDAPRVRAAIAAALDPRDAPEARPYAEEYRILLPDGSTRWIDARGIAEFRGEGEAREAFSMVGTIADVTARKADEERLRTGEERLALAVDAGELGTFYCPMPMGKIVWNAKCNEHFWLAPDAEVDFERFYSILHPDDRERTREAVERAIRDHVGYDTEYRTVAPDGRTRWVRAKGHAYYDASGAPTRFDGVTLDITAQKERESALRDSGLRFREMADTAPAMLWITERDGRCSFLSRGWYEFTGQTEAEGLGFGWANAAHPDDATVAREAFIAANTSERPYEVDFRIRRADGEYRWVIDAGRPRFADDGTFLGFIGSVIDITERKRIEEERSQLLESERAARAEADHASRMKDEFLATLSHELRTPLNAILGWSQIIRRGGARPADVTQGVEVIERNARAQAQIIEDLLEMSRIISGKVRLTMQPVDLGELVKASCETAQPTSEIKRITLGCPVGPRDATISGDPDRLQQVLWNLISNAIKFTPRDGRVEVRLEGDDAQVRLSVVDNGEGIAPEFLPFVFDRFRQADASTTRRFGGLGLGLSIVKQLVELHGGSVEARSAGRGQGSTFIVSLPRSVAPSLPATDGMPVGKAGSTEATAPDVEPSSIAGLRVLVVDDEPDARMLTQRVLEERDAIAMVAGSAREAMTLLGQGKFDVLVSDVGMPGEDGHSLIREIRGRGPAESGGIPAIALTAYARPDDRDRAIRAGFNVHVSKPVEAAELIALIASVAKRA